MSLHEKEAGADDADWFVERSGVVKAPKTSARARRVPIPAALARALREWEPVQREHIDWMSGINGRP